MVILYHKKFAATRGCKLFILMMIFFHEMDYAIWQFFYAIDLQPRVVANLYHKKIAKLHNRFHRKNHHKYKQFATTRGNNFFMI